MIADYEPAAYGVGNLKPDEFLAMTPAEFTPYMKARAKREEEMIKMENERIGLICATLQNGIPIGFAKSGAKAHQPNDYFKAPDAPGKPEAKKSHTQKIFDTMQAWCTATKGGK